MAKEKSDALSELVWGIITDAFKYSIENPNIPPNQSLKDFFIQRLQEKKLGDGEKKLAMQMIEMWGAFVGAPYERQSLKYFWLEECIEGGEPEHKL